MTRMKHSPRVPACLLVALITLLAGCEQFVSADTRIKRAGKLLESGSYAEALLELKNALDDQPGDPRALMDMARVQMRLGHFEDVDKTLGLASTAGVAGADVQALRAELMLATGRAEELLKKLDEKDLALAPRDTRELRVRALGALQRCEEAMPLARVALTEDPTRIPLRLVMAECALRRDHLDAALAELAAAQKENPRHAETWMMLARIHQLTGKPVEAKAAWEKAAGFAASQLSIPQQVVMYSALADTQVARLDTAGLRATRDALLAVVPGSVLVEYVGANVALLDGDADTAVATLQKLLHTNAAFHPGRALLGSALLAQGNLEQARQQIGRLASDVPGSSSFRLAGSLVLKLQSEKSETEAQWLTLAGVHAALGQPALSRAALVHAAEISPRSREVALAQSRLDLRIGDIAGAQRRSQDLLRQYPDDPGVLAFEADVRNASGDFAAAAAALEKLRLKSPSSALAVATHQARRRAAQANALEPLESWLAAHPADVGVRRVYAEGLRLAGDNRGAIREYERVVAEQPEDVGSLNNLAWLYHVEHDERALVVSQRAWGKAPGVAEVVDTHGWLLVESGDLAEGLRLLRQADASAGTRQGEIRFHYATALSRAGQRDEAVRLLEDLMANAGPFPSREQAGALLQSLAGKQST